MTHRIHLPWARILLGIAAGLLIQNEVLSAEKNGEPMPGIQQADENRTDRQALARRHNIKINTPDPKYPLQVGNGEFAFNADVTGLQTLYGNILSTWAWYAFGLPKGMTIADRTRSEIITHGRKRYYLSPVPEGQETLAQWLDDNPHRMNLGRLRFVNHAGKALNPENLTGINQQLDLWSGVLTSEFIWEGEKVRV